MTYAQNQLRWLVLDVASASLSEAVEYVKPAAERNAPSNYKDPIKIAEWQAADYAEDVEKAGLDWDLARVTGAAILTPEMAARSSNSGISMAENEAVERLILKELAVEISHAQQIICYGGRNFDLPLLMRRALYLDVEFPEISLDKFRTPVIDLCERLSYGERKNQKPLSFWIKRHKWADLVKPLSGKEEAQIFEHSRWSDLAAALAHDVEATRRLAVWAKVIR